jgi:TRAP-type C4-dicarboxylate transport system permease small subunit
MNADPEALVMQQTARHGPSPFAPVSHQGLLEWLFLWASKIIILVMIVIIGTELVTRNLFGFSYQLSDEYGGYLLAALSFFSLSVCQANGYSHRVEFIQVRLSELHQAAWALFFDILCTAFCVVLLWQMILLEHGSWNSGELAPTILMTPLWIPQLALPLGAAALTVSVLKNLIADFGWIVGAIRRRFEG